MINEASMWVTSTVLFWHKKHLFSLSFYGGWGSGRILKLYKNCQTISQSFLWKPQFCSIHMLKQMSIHGYYFFPLRTIWAGDSFVISDSEKVVLECMTSFTCNILLSQTQTDALYDSFPNKSPSILSCNHCTSLCCLLRLAKKKSIIFSRSHAVFWLERKYVEELMVLQ